MRKQLANIKAACNVMRGSENECPRVLFEGIHKLTNQRITIEQEQQISDFLDLSSHTVS